MRFITLILKNVLNRAVRTALTAIGLSVAIAAVVILVGISWNFERSFMAIYSSKKIDLVVVHAGSSNQLSSSLDVRLADRLRQIDGVADVAPSLVDTVAFEDKNLASVLVNGWEPESLLFRGIRILDGRPLQHGRRPRGPAGAGAGPEPRQEGRRHARRLGREIRGRGDLREREPVRERRADHADHRPSRR